MKRSLVALAMTVSTAGCAGADGAYWDATDFDENSIRVATYNIHHWLGRDDVVDVARIGRVIDSLNVDVVAIQEADNNLVGEGDLRRQELFLEHLDGAWVRFGESDEDPAAFTMHGNAIFVRPGIEVVTTRVVDVSEPDRDPRAFTDTVLDVRGTQIRLVGAHFGLNGRERERQVMTLAGHLAAADEVDGTVVLGDFNEWNPLAPTFRPLRAVMRDIGGARTFPSSNPVFRLDRIFASDHVEVDHVEVFRSADSSVASDHLPVRAELAF